MRSPPVQAVSHLEVDPRRINASRKVGAVGRNAARLMAEACGLLRHLEEAEREIPPSLMCVCSYLCDAVGHKFGEGSRSVVTGEMARERSLCGGAERGERKRGMRWWLVVLVLVMLVGRAEIEGLRMGEARRRTLTRCRRRETCLRQWVCE